MVRQKKVDAQKQAETNELLQKCKLKFKQDLTDLQNAKRQFSTIYVEEIIKQLEEILPSHILDLQAQDFIRIIRTSNLTSEEEENDEVSFSTPPHYVKKFKSISTDGGSPIQIPCFIEPQFNGSVLLSRAYRQGELLFSVNGTPVIPPMSHHQTDSESEA